MTGLGGFHFLENERMTTNRPLPEDDEAAREDVRSLDRDGDRNDLITAAEVNLLLATYDQGNRLLRLLIENTKNANEFASHMELMVRTATDQQSVETRRRRVRALALAQHNPTLAQEIKKSQIEGSEYLAETMQIALDKGWLRPDINVKAFSYWQQGIFFGHKLLDISEEDDLHEPWNEIAIIALRAFLQPR